ncbi:uncharacterized protein G2W53_020207 [Senna tora]|uniref:Uncharacterized protein n=1 Tax=Senna tora TaxID=362788 RepID=A0A834TVI4_9FABA|nr:uncharacterized protein G2W53_020207 [Senna tora]
MREKKSEGGSSEQEPQPTASEIPK